MSKKKKLTDLDWAQLENHVRVLASSIWDCKADPKNINGVDCDAVLEIKPDYWVLIEVSRESSLDKLRVDLAKFATVRPFLFQKQIYAQCLFVCLKPSQSLIGSGSGQQVEVLSPDDLERRFFDYARYSHCRSSHSFGSAVTTSGEADERPYVAVEYYERDSKRTYSIDVLARWLADGRRIILLGGFGSGKSRCTRELFERIEELIPQMRKIPIAIDLRESWGLKRGSEIVRRHFDELGLPDLANSLLKILHKRSSCLLLDGFDEVASQSWSEDGERLSRLRREALLGVRDLVQRHKGGLLITGRYQFFNSDDEMFGCLGLDDDNVLVLSCAEEFSPDQAREYLTGRIDASTLPPFLPKRPLVLQILTDLGQDDMDVLFSSAHSESRFWSIFLDAIAQREARIHSTLDGSTIRAVLLELAQLTREKSGSTGPITLAEINGAFEKVVGHSPRDEAAVVLQRLPTLGRVNTETSDRRFLDLYILDGLRGTSLVESVINNDWESQLRTPWIHALGFLGRSIVEEALAQSGMRSTFLHVLRRSSRSPNKTLAGDLLSGLLLSGDRQNYQGLVLDGGDLGIIDLTYAAITGLKIEGATIEELRVGAEQPVDFEIKDCIIQLVRGLSVHDPRPSWLVDCEINEFSALSNLARIKEANLSRGHEILVACVHRLFFQPGSGRKEQALLRGFGDSADKKSAKKVISLLKGQELIIETPGDDGIVYVPVRKHTRRMGRLLSQLRNSRDPIWLGLEEGA